MIMKQAMKQNFFGINKAGEGIIFNDQAVIPEVITRLKVGGVSSTAL